jgi:hypothetical protein
MKSYPSLRVLAGTIGTPQQAEKELKDGGGDLAGWLKLGLEAKRWAHNCFSGRAGCSPRKLPVCRPSPKPRGSELLTDAKAGGRCEPTMMFAVPAREHYSQRFCGSMALARGRVRLRASAQAQKFCD